MANAMFDAYGGGSYGGESGYADEELYKQSDGSTGTAQTLDEAAQPKSSGGQYSDSMPNDTNVERENKPSDPSPQPSTPTATTAPAPMAGSEQTFGQMEQDGRARPPMPDDLYAQHTEIAPEDAQSYNAGAGMPSQQMPSQQPYGGFTEDMGGYGGERGQVLPFQPYVEPTPSTQGMATPSNAYPFPTIGSSSPSTMFGGDAPQPFTPYAGPTLNVPQMLPQGIGSPVGGGEQLPINQYMPFTGDQPVSRYGYEGGPTSGNDGGDANYGGDSGDTSGYTPPAGMGGPMGGGGDTLPPDMFGNYATANTSGGDLSTNGLTPNMFGGGNQLPFGNDVGDANYAPDTSGFPGGDQTMSNPQPFTPYTPPYTPSYTPPSSGTDTSGNPSPLGNDEMIFGRPANGGAPAAYQPPAYIPPDKQQFAPSPFAPYEAPIQRPIDSGMPQNSPAPVPPTVAPTMTPTPAVPSVTRPTPPAQPTYAQPPVVTPPVVTPPVVTPPVVTPPATTTAPPATTPVPVTSGVSTPPATGTTTPSSGDGPNAGEQAPVVPTSTQGTVTNTGTGAGTNTSKSTFDLLQSLIAGAGGKGQGSELRAQAMKAASDRLAAPNPYGEAQYRAQYENQARGINDQFATSQRRLSDEMAARGLYGSVGKDFNSGRAADLNIGQRNALSDMSMNLANEQARNQAAYQQQGIDQALAASGLDQNSAMQYINSLMGYGQNAFNNDLATNAANSRDAQAQQDFLLQMLKAGYGG